MFAEAVSIAVLNLAVIAGQANTMNAVAFRQTAAARLASGDLPYHALRALSDHVDTYVGKILATLNAPADIRMGAIGGCCRCHRITPNRCWSSSPGSPPRPTLQRNCRASSMRFERLVRRRNLPPDSAQSHLRQRAPYPPHRGVPARSNRTADRRRQGPHHAAFRQPQRSRRLR